MTQYMFDVLGQAEQQRPTADLLNARPFVRRGLAMKPGETIHAKQSEKYEASPDLRLAINTAIALGQPLLLTGQPGCGKTQAAYWIASTLKLGQVLEFTVRSTSVARDLLYEFEAVRYMAACLQVKEGPLPERSKFVIKRPLWLAFEAETTRVLLIDEIDKAPRDFPNDLLRELDQWSFTIDELGELGKPPPPPITVRADHRPIVVITSNSERPLPDAFLRRCVFHHIELSRAMITKILRARREAGDFAAKDEDIDAAADLPGKLGVSRPPGVAELLAWLAVKDIDANGDANRTEGPVPYPGVLLKTPEDQKAKGLAR
jgi:MoxR-like ATPase